MYDQILQRYIVYNEKLTENTTQVVVRETKDFQEGEILRGVAKQYKKKTGELLFIKCNSSLGWNDSCEFVYDEQYLPATSKTRWRQRHATQRKSLTGLEGFSESTSRLSGSSTTFNFSETQAEIGDLKVTYYDPKNSGSFGVVQSLSIVADRPAKEWLSGQETYTLHRPVRHNFQLRRIIVSGIDDQWQADLIHLTKLKKFNNGHTFVLIVIDVFSKFAWAEPLRRKQAKASSKPLQKL